MLKPADIIVDRRMIGGSEIKLTNVAPDYEYVNNKRTSNLLGYRYDCVVDELGYEKLSVKIPGGQLLESPSSKKGFAVVFQNLELGISAQASGDFVNISLKGTATGIAPANDAAPTEKAGGRSNVKINLDSANNGDRTGS